MPLELYLLAYFVCVFLQYLGFYLFIYLSRLCDYGIHSDDCFLTHVNVLNYLCGY